MVKIDFYKNKSLKLRCPAKKKISNLARLCIEKINSKMLDSIIEVYFVSREKISQINRDFRQITDETDTLSFPQNFLPAAKEKVLGTIFISPEVAKERDESWEEVFIHGMLHILGLDHEKNLKKWQKAENKITKGLMNLKTKEQ